MTRSDTINELGQALATAQAAIVPARKDSENPHFRSKYADLASIWEACRVALSAAGLSVIQSPRLVLQGELWCVELETLLLHTSGQWVSDTLAVPVSVTNAQAVGSAITYSRRYALAAFVGVAPDDDDGHAATGRDVAKRPKAIDRATGEVLDTPAPAAPPQSEDRPAIESVIVKVSGIVKRPTGTGHKYVITGTDGHTYHTFSESLASGAKVAQAAGLPIEIVFSETQYGRQIQTLREPDTADAVI